MRGSSEKGGMSKDNGGCAVFTGMVREVRVTRSEDDGYGCLDVV
jgi:hypothetical protein